ncbi:hypothetical protein Tco_0770083 [Tanacetum coccineum]|uniref:Uncharacterized protein n=1 Tax=Tanacetum coccineum TaxID=301880 RepID=A0ABQ4ZEQ9_9ASTR
MKYFCYVKHAMPKFEKETVSKQSLPRENVFITSSFEDNVKRIARNRLSEEFEPLVKDVNLQLKFFEKSLVKEMKDDLKYVMSLEDEFDETCLILDIQQEFFKTQFESVKSYSYSHEYENEIFEQNSSLENENHCLKKTITELSKQAADVKEEMTKRCAQYEKDFVLSNKSDEAKIKFDTKDLKPINIELEYSVASLPKENAHLKTIYQNLFDSIKRSRVQTKSSNIFQNEAEKLKSQLSEFADKRFDKVFQKIESMKKKKFGTRISNDFLQKSLYDIDSSNVESESREKKILFGNETSSFETKIKELEMILAQQTKDFEDAKIQDSKAEKDQFLKQIASLESKLASQDLLSIRKEYGDLRTLYNALKAKFDSLNRDKEKSPVSNFSTPKKFSKKPQVYETPTSQKVFKSSDSSRKKQVFKASNSRFTPLKQVWRPKQSHSKPFKYLKSEILSLQNKNDSALKIPNSGIFPFISKMNP